MIQHPVHGRQPNGKIQGRKEKVLPRFREEMWKEQINPIKTTGSKE
jgi:hypothetical protein